MARNNVFERSNSSKRMDVSHSARSRGRSVRRRAPFSHWERVISRQHRRAPQRLTWDLEATCVVKNAFLSVCAPSSRSAARSGASEGASHAADSTPRIYMPFSMQWSHSARLRGRRGAPSEARPRVIESLVDPTPGWRARGAG